jgi:hypothetical protein
MFGIPSLETLPRFFSSFAVKESISLFRLWLLVIAFLPRAKSELKPKPSPVSKAKVTNRRMMRVLVMMAEMTTRPPLLIIWTLISRTT